MEMGKNCKTDLRMDQCFNNTQNEKKEKKKKETSLIFADLEIVAFEVEIFPSPIEVVQDLTLFFMFYLEKCADPINKQGYFSDRTVWRH